MVAIGVQLPQHNIPSSEELPRTARAGIHAGVGVHTSAPQLPQPPPALPLLTLTAAAGQATSQTADSTENPSKYRGKISFPSRQASNRLLRQHDPT